MPYGGGVGPNTKKLQGQVSVSNASATIWAAVSGQRWTLESFAVGWSGMTVNGDITIREDSTTIIRIPVTTTYGFWPVDYLNWSSSATGSSLRINGPSGTVTGLFVGRSGGE